MQIEQAQALALRLMAAHGLGHWSLVVDRARTRAGVCRAEQREIGLSRPLTELHSEAEVTDTVLHEIAHALVGPRHGHDAVWRAKALAIGCSGTRCLPLDAARVDGLWEGTCPAGHRVTRHRVPTRVQSCRHCRPGFDLSSVFTWTHEGRAVPMHPAYAAELARLHAGPAAPPAPVVVPVGSRVRLVGAGRFCGTVGVVEKRARTRYHVRTRAGLVSAAFSDVRPL